MKNLFIVFVCFIGHVHAASFEIIGREEFKEAVEEVMDLLPENFFKQVSKKIYLREEVLKTDSLLGNDLCHLDPKIKLGFTYKNSIRISSKLVSLAVNDKKSFDCGHGSFLQTLYGVIIHELTHIKDNVERISTEHDFQRIVGVKRIQRSSKRTIFNQNFKTSVDPYEFTNLEESLAVNSEYLFLDPEFECRKPATANYLAEKFEYRLPGKCKKNFKVMLQSSYLEDNYLRDASLDPKRIYEIHYLFASKGKQIMSKWGHAMIRIVICAPWRKEVSKECLLDISHHVVLSYRAQLTELSLDYLKGLSGKYPSQLFVLGYSEVQQEYNKFEFRDLYSVPMKFSKNQIRDFVNLTLERYWTYSGKYYFLSNNCGTETVKHLAYVLTEDQEHLVRSLTPLRTFNDIVRNNEISGEYSISKSHYDDFLIHYAYITQYLPELRYKNIKKFLDSSKAPDRLLIYKDFFSSPEFHNMKDKQVFIMKFLYLERYISAKFLLQFPNKILKKMNKSKELRKEMAKFSSDLKRLIMNPWDIVESTYGMPLEEEYDSRFRDFREQGREAIRITIEEQLRDIEKILSGPVFQNEIREIEALRDIRKLMMTLVKDISL